MFAPLTRALIAREEPVLHAHDISMWGYIVLTALAEQPVRTQAALAQAIGADKSRIISDLDELQQRGLIQRQPDAADRRVHLLSLTPAGDRLRQAIVLVAGAQRQQCRRRDDGETHQRIDDVKNMGHRQDGEDHRRDRDDEPNAARSPSNRRRAIFGQAHWTVSLARMRRAARLSSNSRTPKIASEITNGIM